MKSNLRVLSASLALIFAFAAAAPLAHATSVEIHNESAEPIQVAIVYKHGVSWLFTPNWTAMGYYTIQPGNSRRFRMGLAGVKAEGYIRIAESDGRGGWIPATYGNRSSARRRSSSREGYLESTETLLAVPADRDFDWVTADLFAGGEVLFNLHYAHTSNVTSLEINVTEDGIESSIRSVH